MHHRHKEDFSKGILSESIYSPCYLFSSFTKGSFFCDYSVYSYSDVGITEHTEYHCPKEQTLCYSQNRIADVQKIKAMRPRKSGYAIFPPRDRRKLPKEHDYRLFCLFLTNRYSINSAIGSRIDGILFRSFRNQNRSQKNTITANSVYSHSGIVPNERALKTWLSPALYVFPLFFVVLRCPSLSHIFIFLSFTVLCWPPPSFAILRSSFVSVSFLCYLAQFFRVRLFPLLASLLCYLAQFFRVRLFPLLASSLLCYLAQFFRVLSRLTLALSVLPCACLFFTAGLLLLSLVVCFLLFVFSFWPFVSCVCPSVTDSLLQEVAFVFVVITLSLSLRRCTVIATEVVVVGATFNFCLFCFL